MLTLLLGFMQGSLVVKWGGLMCSICQVFKQSQPAQMLHTLKKNRDKSRQLRLEVTETHIVRSIKSDLPFRMRQELQILNEHYDHCRLQIHAALQVIQRRVIYPMVEESFH